MSSATSCTVDRTPVANIVAEFETKVREETTAKLNRLRAELTRTLQKSFRKNLVEGGGKWTRRAVPRQVRPQGTPRPAPPPSDLLFRGGYVDGAPVRKKRKLKESDHVPAQAPASQEISQDEIGCRHSRNPGLAARLALGRTQVRLVQLMHMHLLCKPLAVVPLDGSMPPKPGLFAYQACQDVFILKTFTRHRVPLVDVVPLRAKAGNSEVYIAHFKEIRTCKLAELTRIGLWFKVVHHRVRHDRRYTCLKFRRRTMESHATANQNHPQPLDELQVAKCLATTVVDIQRY